MQIVKDADITHALPKVLFFEAFGLRVMALCMESTNPRQSHCM